MHRIWRASPTPTLGMGPLPLAAWSTFAELALEETSFTATDWRRISFRTQ